MPAPWRTFSTDSTIAGGPAIRWDEEDCLTEEQLFATPEGRKALEAWRRGDDSKYEITELAELTLGDAENELIRVGSEARPDLQDRLGRAVSVEEIVQALDDLLKAGAEALGPDTDRKLDDLS